MFLTCYNATKCKKILELPSFNIDIKGQGKYQNNSSHDPYDYVNPYQEQNNSNRALRYLSNIRYAAMHNTSSRREFLQKIDIFCSKSRIAHGSTKRADFTSFSPVKIRISDDISSSQEIKTTAAVEVCQN
jgi:hypothetical protein